MCAIQWTHPSVVRLLEQTGATDPVAYIQSRARALSLSMMEKGWTGPPYDPFRLADLLGVEVVARQELDDARLVPAGDHARIEFNPERRPERVRFSVAHELGHLLFEDFAERVRHRTTEEREPNEWQLEMLCNVAAAELLMPAGALTGTSEAHDLDLTHLLDYRRSLGVSTEALLRRVVGLSARPCCVFAAARSNDEPVFRVDYSIPSRRWSSPISAGAELHDTVLSHCTAVGYSDHATETWNASSLYVQAVGIPPYPGDRYPRVVGLVEPADDSTVVASEPIHYVRGDASDPRGQGPRIITHVVNDKAQRWSPRGFARSLMDRHPGAAQAYAEWPMGNRTLGSIHLAQVDNETWVASLVAQAGYGPSQGPRLRVSALQASLARLAAKALGLGASIHMPLIGTGQAGMPWPVVRDIVLDELVDQSLDVTVYVLAEAQMPADAPREEQMSLL